MEGERAVHVIDSSVFVAFYHEGDSMHHSAVRELQALDDALMLIHPYVIQEVATVLAYRLSKKLPNEFIRDLLASDNVTIVHHDIRSETAFFLELENKVSFTDASLILLARETNARLVTFDKQMLAIHAKGTRR